MDVKTVNWGDHNYFDATVRIMEEYRQRIKKEPGLKIEDLIQEYVEREVK